MIDNILADTRTRQQVMTPVRPWDTKGDNIMNEKITENIEQLETDRKLMAGMLKKNQKQQAAMLLKKQHQVASELLQQQRGDRRSDILLAQEHDAAALILSQQDDAAALRDAHPAAEPGALPRASEAISGNQPEGR